MTITSPCDSLLDESNDSRQAVTSARPEYTGIITSTSRGEAADGPDLRELINVEPSIRLRDSTDQSKITIPEIPSRESRGEGVVREYIAKRGLLDFTGGRVGHLVYELNVIRDPPLRYFPVQKAFQFIW